MLLVVRHLDAPPTVRLANGPPHRIGDGVGVHDDGAVDVARRPTDGLDEGLLGSQEALLVGVQDGHQGDLGQVQPLPQQVDAHHHIVVAQTQVAQNLHPLDGVNLRVEVVHLDSHLGQVVGQVLGHPLGEGGDQCPLAPADAPVDLPDEVVNLASGGLEDDLGIHQARGTDDLLHHLLALLQFVRPRRGRGVDHLVDVPLELVEGQRAVVQGAGQAEAVLHQGLLAGAVAVVHATDLRDGHVGLIHEQQKVVGEVVQQSPGWLAGPALGQVAGVVLHPGAVANLAQHLQVVPCSLF